MHRDILETSIIVKLTRNLLSIFRHQKIWTLNICRDSHIYKKCSTLSKIIIISFRYSFFWRISEVREGHVGTAAIDNSAFIKRLLSTLKIQKQNLINLETSTVVNLTKEVKKEFYFFPVRVIGIIGAMAVSANTVLSIILHNKDIGLLWWIAQISLLFLSIAGFFCRASWEDMKKTSFFLIRINKCCKIGN